jgi:hypothetical protein
MASPTSPFTASPAEPILRGDPALSDEQRADLFDIFHGSKDPNELVQKLQTLAVPDDTKHRLFQAKQASMPAEPLDKVSSAVDRLAQLDPQKREIAEAHPNLLKALVGAATTPEKGAGEPAGANKTAGKGNTPAGAKTPAPLVQPPRTDGLEHLSPIPDGHHRVLASDGGIHDIPAENIEKARALDPHMHVLNP